MLKQVCDAKVLYMDGTFKASPKLWKQLESVHFEFKDHFITGIVALLPDKKKQTYIRFLTLIRQKAAEFGKEFKPETIQIDFESGMIEAIKEVFGTNVHVRGCLFHFGQALFRHVQSCGLVSIYTEDTDFFDLFNKIKALALLPMSEIYGAMMDIETSVNYETLSESDPIKKFLKYVKETWTNATAKFPRRLWSHDGNDGPRTTNCVEGWHNKLNKRLPHPHPRLFSLIELLKMLQDETESDLGCLERGLTVRQKNPKYVALDREIKRTRMDYDDDLITQNDFLKRIGCLLGNKI